MFEPLYLLDAVAISGHATSYQPKDFQAEIVARSFAITGDAGA